MRKYILSILLILMISLSAFGAGRVIVENEWYYEGLSPSLLTAYKALHYVNGDVHNISVGSLVGGTSVVYENFDPHNATFWAWIKLDAGGNAGQIRTLFHCRNSATDYIWIYVNASNNLVLDICGNSTLQTASTSVSTIRPQTWTHIACTWSKNTDVNGTNNLYVYVNGAGAGSTTAPTSMTAVPATFSVGMDSTGKNCLSGSMAWKLTRYWMASTDITNDYASGSGSADFYCVTPNTVALGLTSENSTSIVSHHIGASVSAIADGASEDTLTVATDASKRFADNDRVCISAGNGYSSNILGNAFVDGTPSTTSMAVDDGAGADVGLVENVGRSINCAGAYYAQAVGNTIHQITTEDFSLSISAKIPTGIVNRGLVAKYEGTTGYGLALTADGNLQVALKDGVDLYAITGTKTINDGKWHHLCGVIDRDNVSNCKLYVDGFLDTIRATSGTLADVGSITNTNLFTIGARSGGLIVLSGQICDAKIAIGTVWTPAEILYQATHPYDISASAGTITEHYACNEGSGTTITASVTPASNNLTLSNALAWNQSAFVSRNLFSNGNFENSNIGNLSRISNATVTANTTNPIADMVDGKAVNTGAFQGYFGTSLKTASGEDYYIHAYVKPQITEPAGSVNLTSIDATASMSMAISDLTTGLVGWWKMNEASWNGTPNEVVDSSGSGNHGTASGANTSTTAVFSKSGIFDGNDSVTPASVISIGTGNVTISLWINGSNPGNFYKSVLYIGNAVSKQSLYFTPDTAGRFQFGIYAVASALVPTVNTSVVYDNMWHHIVGTKDGNVYSLYVDGSLRAQKTIADTNIGTNSFYIGRGVDNYHNGFIDDVRIYNIVLTDKQISDLYLIRNSSVEIEHTFTAADTDTTVDLTVPCAVSGELAYYDNVEVLASLVANGSMEGGADPPTSWVQEASATVVSDTSPHAGTNCLKVTAGANNVGAKQSITLVSGKYYTLTAFAKATSGDSAKIMMDWGDGNPVQVGQTVTSTTWTRIRGSGKAIGTDGCAYLWAVTNTDVVNFDDVALTIDDYAEANSAQKGGGIIPYNQPYLIR